jgi:hypothetical protein
MVKHPDQAAKRLLGMFFHGTKLPNFALQPFVRYPR